MADRLRAGDPRRRFPRPIVGIAPGIRDERPRTGRCGVLMSLRTRLVLAFFLLSVVPLGAVTFYSYTNNVRALQNAAEREADLLAGELGQRMQLVTAQLSERVEHLMDIAELQAVADEASATAAQAQAAVTTTARAETPPAPPANVHVVTSAPGATGTTTVSQSALNDSIARSLGEAAMLLNNVELQNMRNRGGRPPGPPGAPPQSQLGPGGQGANANAGTGAAGQQSGRGFAPQRQ